MPNRPDFKKYVLVLVFAALSSVVWASNAPPPNAGWIDVTQSPYYALPDTGEDVTAALQQAIDDVTLNMPDPNGWGTFLHYRRILYFPDGEYTISAPLVIKDIQNNQSRGYGLTLQGESREGVILRLTDENPDFQDPAQPRAVFSTSQYEPSSAWGTNIAFKINVFDLTVDTGVGNPGAVGLRYIVNNQGSVRNVHIRTSDPDRVGWAGIDIETWSIGGPSLLKDVRIDGFDWGIRYGGIGHYSMVGEHLLLNDQRVGGVRNQGQVFSIRKLTTINQVGPSVAMFNVPGSYAQPGLVTLLEADLAGSGPAAIVVHPNAGRLFLRDIARTGYTNTVDDQGTLVASVEEADYASGGGLSLWGEPFAPLRLSVPETPEPPSVTEDRSLWVDITNYDGNGPYFTPGSQSNPTWGTTNHSAHIQNAIDWAAAQGRTTVYFPFGEYAIGSTLRIHGSVRRVVGNYAVFKTTMEARDVTDHPVIVFEDLDDTLFVEQINLYPGNQKKGIFFVNRSSHDVTIRNAYIGEGKVYLNDGATGRLFLEDVAGLSSRYSGGVIHGHEPQFDFGNQEVWARQFNTEQDGVKVLIDGGQFWALGFKTEEPGTVVHAKNHARVEILGGLLLPSFSDDPEGGNALIDPAFVFADSAATVSITTHSPILNGLQRPYYANIVHATRTDEEETLDWTEVPDRVLAGSDKSVTVLLSIAALEIEDFAPVITVAPLPQTVELGQMATFSVTAFASPDPSYQWYFNGAPMVGEEGATLQIGPVTLAMEGLYQVRVSNAEGEVWSNPVWLETTVPPPGLQLFARINFQTDNAAPEGWLKDIGEVFGDRGNGFQYGWNADNTAMARQRNNENSPDFWHDTLNHMQWNGDFSWQIAVPNGFYQVRIVAGDPGSLDSIYRIQVEDTLVVDGVPVFPHLWFEGEETVEVDDGLLTVTNAEGASNNKICLIEIHRLNPEVDAYLEWAMQRPVGQRAEEQVFGGIPNLLRYALGGAAESFGPMVPLQLETTSSGAEIHFHRIDDPLLAYEIWQSEDLLDWGTEPVWSGTGSGSVPVLLETSAPRAFYRLVVKR